ncbi:MAG: Ig-like domain-containing protein [Candidatus Saccharimonadales bacterium]
MSDTIRFVRAYLKIQTLTLLVIGGALITAGHINTDQASAAVCGSEPTSTTGKVTQTITVPATDDYTIWSRMKAPSATAVEYQVYVDGECFTIGQTSLTAGTLTWVDHENGSTSDKATINLPAGSHTLVLTAGSEDLELDRVMFLSDGCIPTSTGNNCQNDTTSPTTSISSPTAGATLSATSTITASATDNDAIDFVEFYRGGSTLLGTDSSAPYNYGWDTTTVTDGGYSLTVRAYDLSGNVTTSAAVSVTVNNAPPVNASITSFTATPSTITTGQSSQLDWVVSAGTGCSINQSVGNVALTGSQSVSPASTVTYTLTCNGQNGGTSDSETATVTVNPAPVNANITSFTATPSTITTGQTSSLAWSVSAGTNCSINQSVGAVGATGNQTVSPTVTTIYTMTCDGLNGGTGDTETATVTFNTSPVNANITSFTVTPATITEGQSSSLAWSVSAGANCSINQSVGAVSATGNQTVSPTTTTTYTMTCDGLNSGAGDTETTILTVNPAPVNANITSFTPTPGTITEGQSSSLAWSVSAGQTCSINQSIGPVSLSGSQSVSPTTTTTYTLTCQGLNGGASDSENATVTVNPAPINADITSFTASPLSISDAPGQSSALTWAVAAGTGCSINQSIGSVATSGTQSVSPTSTLTYTLTCSGQFGGTSDTAQATVTVTAAPDTDNDGAKDYIENAGPNSGDANNDATPDAQQTNIVTFINTKTSLYNSIIAASDCDVIDNTASQQGLANHPHGVWAFTLACASAGQSGQVEILLDKQYDTTGWKMVKVNTALTTSKDITSQVTVANKVLGTRTVTSLSYTATDGGVLDEDMIANSTIVDPVAVLGTETTTPNGSLSNTGESIYFYIGLAIVAVITSAVAIARTLHSKEVSISSQL